MNRKRTRKKRISLKRTKKLKTILICIIAFAIILTALLSISFKPVETTEEGKIKITIESPLNQTYYTENVILKVVASNTTKWMADSIDGGKNTTACYSCDSYTIYYLKFTRGTHIIRVYASDYEDGIIQATAVFTVT